MLSEVETSRASKCRMGANVELARLDKGPVVVVLQCAVGTANKQEDPERLDWYSLLQKYIQYIL